MGGLPASFHVTRLLVVLLLACGFGANSARAFDAFDGRIQAHGFFESQLRAINANFSEDWDVTQWYNIFNLELEFDIAPDGVGPIDLLQAYVRAEVRYDCIYSRGCGMVRSINAYGDRSKSLPRRLNGGHDQLGAGVFPRASVIAGDSTAVGTENDPNAPNYGADLRNGTKSFTGERLSGDSTDPVALNQVRGFEGLYLLPGADGIIGVPTADCNPKGGIPFSLAPFGGTDCDFYAGGARNSTFRLRGTIPPDQPAPAPEIPDVGPLIGLQIDDPAQYVLENFTEFRFAQIDARGGGGNGRPTQVLGPWLPKNFVEPIATLADRVNPFDSTRTAPTLRSAVFNNTFNDEFERRFGDNVMSIGDPVIARNVTLQQARQVASDAMLEPAPGRTAIETRDIWYGRNAVQDALRLDPFISDANLRRSVPFPKGAGARDFRPIPYTDEGNNGAATTAARGLYLPSQGLREVIAGGDLEPTWLLNLTENERAWNRGFSQRDEKELKEAYLDIEMLDSRLWLRIGRQQIVWGKTELFRTTDQFNPVDVGLASLPSLEESRIALWAFRSVYSLYEVGPLQDVRLEFAFNFDQVTPVDLGGCGEPYVVNPVCSANFGAFAHGLTGIGVAGVDLPPDPWSDAKGWELGARIEFRWDRFSFAISDFWGYDDFPYLERISTYERNVDPNTGRPRSFASRNPCTYTDYAGSLSNGNRTPAGQNGQANNNPATGTVVVGNDPGCLLPGVTDRTIRDPDNASDPFAGFITQTNDVFRASQAALTNTNTISAGIIPPTSSRRNPFQDAVGFVSGSLSQNSPKFDSALVQKSGDGAALRPDGTTEISLLEQLNAGTSLAPGTVPLTASDFEAGQTVNPNNALDAHPANLQFFGFVCASTVGFTSLDPTACAQTVFGSTALASESAPGIGGLSRVLGQVFSGDPLSAFVNQPLAGTTLPLVALSRDSDTPVLFFRGTDISIPGQNLPVARNAQEGIVINQYDSQGELQNLSIVQVDPTVLATSVGNFPIDPILSTHPFTGTPTERNRFFDSTANGISNFLPGAVWLGSAENRVPFYASCTYQDFRNNLRNCDQNYKVGQGDAGTLNNVLTAQQEALLGCGPFWGTNCDEQGVDLLNAEASVLLQSFPGMDGTAIPAGQDPNTSGGQWRTDGLEPGARVMALGPAEAGGTFFNFSCSITSLCFNGQNNEDGFFEPIPTPGVFMTDAQLEAAGRPRRYTQPGTLPFVVANASYNSSGERRDYVCTTGDIGGSDTSILPGCRTKWKDRQGGTLNLYGIDLECRNAAIAAVNSGGTLADPRCIAGTPENRALIQSLTHLSEIEKQALLNRPRGGAFLGGDENFRADPRSWSVQVDGDPDRVGFDGAGTYTNRTQKVRNEILFRTRAIINSNPGIAGQVFTPSTARGQGHPFTGQPFANELAGLSWNFLSLVVSTSSSYTNNLFDPDDANEQPDATPQQGGLSVLGAPLAYSTYDPVDPDNAPMVQRIAEIDAEIATLDPGNPAQLTRIRELESERRAQAANTKPICSFITPQMCETVGALMGIAGQKRNTVAAGGNDRYGRRSFSWHGGGEVVIKFNKRNVLGFGMDFAEDYTKSNWGVEATWIQGNETFDPNEFDNFSKTDTFNLTLSMDRPTFINFLNPNRTFFITTQWFFQYRDGYHSDMTFNGPWNVLGIVAINTGYFQDRLLPSLLGVYDVQSASGAVIPQVTYRFNENFSATLGLAGFWGRTERATMLVNDIGPPGNRTNGSLQYWNTAETGLAIVRQRDEVFLRLRYTF